MHGRSVDLANDMIRNDTIPSDWENSSIINIYKRKGYALIRGNYRGLKLLDHVMKRIDRVIEKIIRERVFIDDMQFRFMLGRGTTDAIFILRQLQEKHLAENKKLHFVFVDLEKAFDRVPRTLRLCTTTPEVKLDSITPTMMNLELKLEFIRVQYFIALSYSSS